MFCKVFMCRKILCSSCCCCCCCCKKKLKVADMESESESKYQQQPGLLTDGNQKPSLLANRAKISKNKPHAVQNLNGDATDNVKDSAIEILKSPDENTFYILSKFIDDIKTAVLDTQQLGQLDHPKEFILIGYQSQFIAGTDYFLKIYEPISENYYHLRVYESLQGDLTLLRMSAPKKESDPILYF